MLGFTFGAVLAGANEGTFSGEVARIIWDVEFESEFELAYLVGEPVCEVRAADIGFTVEKSRKFVPHSADKPPGVI